ncbi:MAG: OsmC family protein [Calothrix sp. FI2-JRJ7]|jgi:organic hydroperoxide reductase OsmC/OhrA|nr:OsmC family protein [Calothrix sp. FI2-JRJ7]
MWCQGLNFAFNFIPNVTGADREKSEQAVHEAHKVCPYSKAIKRNVDVELVVV